MNVQSKGVPHVGKIIFENKKKEDNVTVLFSMKKKKGVQTTPVPGIEPKTGLIIKVVTHPSTNFSQ